MSNTQQIIELRKEFEFRVKTLTNERNNLIKALEEKNKRVSDLEKELEMKKEVKK
jgi:hypothetical protein